MLDDVEFIKTHDPQRILNLIMKFPDDIKSAVKNARELDIKLFYPDLKKGDIRSVIVSGMGGSGISGNIVRDLLYDELEIPVIVNKTSRLPAYANENSLLIVVSYSGNTEETLSAFSAAIERKIPTIAVTSGGKLESLARKNEVPVIKVPGDYPPRTALPHLLFSVYISIEQAGLVEKLDTSQLVKTMKKLGKLLSTEMGVSRNPAKQCALKIRNLFPHIYVWDKYGSVALRWKTQLNENSKIMAISGVFSEMNHNEVVGWDGTMGTEPAAVILRTEDEPKEILKRMEFMTHIFKRKGRLIEVPAEGNSKLEKLLSLIFIGDYTSVYLAVINEIDPTPVQVIEDMKKEISK